jgi:hypothetical protein
MQHSYGVSSLNLTQNDRINADPVVREVHVWGLGCLTYAFHVTAKHRFPMFFLQGLGDEDIIIPHFNFTRASAK